MKRVLAALLLVFTAFVPASVSAAPHEALCIVCQVKEGTTHAEPVRATRTYEGKEYAFCSEKCAQEFMADPLAYVPPDLPRPAPAFAVRGLDGKAITLESLRGQVVLLDFLATWCSPCLKTMPELDALHREHRAKGLTVLGVSIDEDGPEKVRKFAKARKVTYPIALDDPAAPAWSDYRVKAIPAAFLIDREGRIVAQWTGAAPDAKALKQKLADALAAEPAAATP